MNKHMDHWETCVTCRSLRQGGTHPHALVHLHWNAFHPELPAPTRGRPTAHLPVTFRRITR